MPVRIRIMTNEEFEDFCQWSVEDHADGLMEEKHLSREEAVRESEVELTQMLPEGLHTPYNYLMTIEETHSGETAGFIWTIHEITDGRKQCFLCDFAIREPKRRRGYASAALALAEQQAAEVGCRESVLFVADSNTAAQALYEKTGYQFLRRQSYGKYLIKQLI